MLYLPACTVEDASSGPMPCHWDGGSAGNGTGLSFTVTSADTFVYDSPVEQPGVLTVVLMAGVVVVGLVLLVRWVVRS